MSKVDNTGVALTGSARAITRESIRKVWNLNGGRNLNNEVVKTGQSYDSSDYMRYLKQRTAVRTSN
jgi:hypothetical protein